MRLARESWVGLALVVAVHAGGLAAALWVPAPSREEIVLPTVQGVLIPAPPAEQVQLPSAQEVPPEPPKPEQSEPKEKPKPKPKPKPEPKPKPKPPPKAPPSEKAIRQEVEAPEPPPPPPKPPSSALAEKNDTLGAPIIPPRQDANPLNNPAPAYPTISRRLREQGVVVLRVLILPDGSVGEVQIEESSGYERLDETAAKAVRQWQYIPARRGDETIAYWYLQPLEFSLN